MRKFILLFLLIILSSGFSPADFIPAFKTLKTDIVAQLNELFDREISVESVSGILINQIELNNVRIAKEKKLADGSIITAKKIIINYNPFKLATGRGNITSAISKIVIMEPEILVERSIRDEWNMARLIPVSRSPDENVSPQPLLLNAKILIRGGHGIYVDHLGFGEDLKGKAFTTQIRGFDADIKLSGNRIELSSTATSVIDKAIAWTRTTGSVNIKTGKYRFVVTAKNVDIEKWGYYTMNIPHFKAISGKSDMVMTMTNPPPRKKGLPIFFDGKFTIKGGKAVIFDRLIENMNGFVGVHDEESTFKNLKGERAGVQITANGRLFDFSVAYYDIDLSFPYTDALKIKTGFPEISGLDFSGKASANIHVGGDYGDPVFDGTILANGLLFQQKVSGSFDLSYTGTVLTLMSDNIAAYEGTLLTESIFDFTHGGPNINIRVKGDEVSMKNILPFASPNEIASLEASINGTVGMLTFNVMATDQHGGSLSAFGTLEGNDYDISLSSRGIKLEYERFNGGLNDFSGKLTGTINKNTLLKGKADLGACILAGQNIDHGSLDFKLEKNELIVSSLVLDTAGSQISIKGRTGFDCPTDLHIEGISLEASEMKMLDPLIPKDISPVSGMLDLSIDMRGCITKEADIDPQDFLFKGKITLREGYVAQERLVNANFDFYWSNRRLILNRSNIKTDFTDLLVSGTIEESGKVSLRLSGDLDLSNLKPVTLKYGRLFGYSKIDCNLEGNIKDPGVDIDFDVSELRFNEITLDRASGRIIYDGKNIFLTKPVVMELSNDRYMISGKISLLKDPVISLKFEALSGDLNTAAILFDEIRREVSTKHIFGPLGEIRYISVSPGKLAFPKKSPKALYKSDGNATALGEIKKAENESSEFSRTLKEKTGINLNGKFFGYIEAKGPIGRLSGKMDLIVTGGTWESYRFDEARIKAALEGGTFEVDSAYIKKADGVLLASGDYNPNSSVSLNVKADKMPIDILSIITGGNKQYKGNFDMTASINGRSKDPNGQASLKADNVNIAGVEIEGLQALLAFSNDTLYFKKMELFKGGKRSSVLGLLPLNKDGVSLDITLEGESVGLFTLASNDISWISGKGTGYFKITGKITDPKINGFLSLENAGLNFKSTDSNLESINSNLKTINNVMTTDALSGKWVGKWTQWTANKIKLSGSMSWNKLFSFERSVNVDLKLKDGDYAVDIPNLYKGDLSVRDLRFSGPLFQNEAQKAPKLTAILDISNGVIYLPDMSKKRSLSPIKLDVVMNIQKNTAVSAGDIKNLINTDFSNVIMNLEIEGRDILVSGDLNDPIIVGKTVFKQGTVNILNREFSLMSEDRQKNIYAADLEKVKENSATFQQSSLPNIALAAEVKVKSVEKIIETGKPVAYKMTNYLVVSRINGVPFSKEKEEGINLIFDSFFEDNTKQPPELIPTGFDQQDNKVLLLPDFIKGPLGISEKGVGDVDANDVLVDYLNSRLNAYILRDVERSLAKSLDLESLTLEYNFGKDIKNMFPANNPAVLGPQEVPETMYGIGAVKGFFDRFYLDVKYSQAVQETALINKAYLNYQITYKLNPVLSVVYYREPFSFIEEESDYYKVTLKAGYQL